MLEEIRLKLCAGNPEGDVQRRQRPLFMLLEPLRSAIGVTIQGTSVIGELGPLQQNVARNVLTRDAAIEVTPLVNETVCAGSCQNEGHTTSISTCHWLHQVT